MMSGKRNKRRSEQGTVLACRSLPLPFFALYGLAAAGLTWMVAAWRDSRNSLRLREEIRAQNRADNDKDV
jgi:hypothetical protein